MTRHALRNASIPTITVVGLEVGFLLGGSIIIEVLFSYPGMGRMMIDAITQRDYPVVQATLLFYAVSFVLVNFATDVFYSVLDPRVRVS
jgi:peptide/nickel transport system permease protein